MIKCCRTPGHPESHLTPGIEVTTGPLGQGFANAVGMAIAQVHAHAIKATPACYKTFVILGDGCQMEGVTSEAASLAGHLNLSNLIAIYDDNRISIDGPTNLTFTENVGKRFEAYGWRVFYISNGDTDLVEMETTLQQALDTTLTCPTLVVLRTTIGKGSRLEGTEKVHGSPLQAEDIASLKASWGITGTFSVQGDDVYRTYREAFAKGLPQNDNTTAPQGKHSPNNLCWTTPAFGDKALATRKCSEMCIEAICGSSDIKLMGGSADLTPSTLTRWLGAHDFHGRDCPEGRYIRFGVREHAMAAICNGMAAWNPPFTDSSCIPWFALRPFASTFLNFITYAWGAVRLGALAALPVLYIMTHDSIGLGEDGPTHQPVEVLSLLRATPNLSLWRPADGVETNAAYRAALLHNLHKPTVLSLSRQNLPQICPPERIQDVMRGGYVLLRETGPQLTSVIIATGSEVSLVWQAINDGLLPKESTRLVSLPSWDIFEQQSREYRLSVIPDDTKNNLVIVSVEAASTFGWDRYAKFHIGIDRFGTSGPFKDVYAYFGLTPKDIAKRIHTFSHSN